jgi:hypothetical protein
MNGTGLAGTRIEFWPSEMLTAAGGPDQATTGKSIYDSYTLAGLESESFTLQFMYHGMQYIAVCAAFLFRVLRPLLDANFHNNIGQH